MTSIIICLEQFVEEKRKHVKRPSCRKEWYSYSFWSEPITDFSLLLPFEQAFLGWL